jgi:hypothetical protein
MPTREALQQLYKALTAHKAHLEITERFMTDVDLDRRIEAARLLLEWLEPALEPEPPASPEVQTPPPSTSPVDQHQTPPSAPDPPKTSRW